MRELLVTCLFLLSANIYAELSPWVFHRNYGDTDIFLSREGDTRLTISYTTTTKKVDLTQKEAFYKEIEKAKKATLSFAGVHHWKADKYKLEKVRNFVVLDIDGSYIDGDNDLVYFKERHYYANGRFLQLLATNYKKENLKKSLEKNSLSGMKVKYGFSY